MEARFGDSNKAAEWELGFAYETNAPFSPQKPFTWENATATSWTLAWDGTTLTFTIGSTMLTSSNPSAVPFGGVVIEAKATPRNKDGVAQGSAKILMNNIAVDGTALSGSAMADSTAQRIQLIAIAGLDTSGWTLTGQSTMTWFGDYLPDSQRVGSRLGFQLKIGMPPMSGDVDGDPVGGTDAVLAPCIFCAATHSSTLLISFFGSSSTAFPDLERQVL